MGRGLRLLVLLRCCWAGERGGSDPPIRWCGHRSGPRGRGSSRRGSSKDCSRREQGDCPPEPAGRCRTLRDGNGSKRLPRLPRSHGSEQERRAGHDRRGPRRGRRDWPAGWPERLRERIARMGNIDLSSDSATCNAATQGTVLGVLLVEARQASSWQRWGRPSCCREAEGLSRWQPS